MAKGMTKRRRDEKKPKKEVVKVIAAAPSMKNTVAINTPKPKSREYHRSVASPGRPDRVQRRPEMLPTWFGEICRDAGVVWVELSASEVHHLGASLMVGSARA